VVALTVVNALETSWTSGGHPGRSAEEWGLRRSQGRALCHEEHPISLPGQYDPVGGLDRRPSRQLQCGIVARMSHDGLARAIDPVHTPVDGAACLSFHRQEGDQPLPNGAAQAERGRTEHPAGSPAATGLGGVPAIADIGDVAARS